MGGMAVATGVVAEVIGTVEAGMEVGGAASAPDWPLAQSSVGCSPHPIIGSRITIQAPVITMIPVSIIAYDASVHTIRTAGPILGTMVIAIRVLDGADWGV